MVKIKNLRDLAFEYGIVQDLEESCDFSRRVDIDKLPEEFIIDWVERNIKIDVLVDFILDFCVNSNFNIGLFYGSEIFELENINSFGSLIELVNGDLNSICDDSEFLFIDNKYNLVHNDYEIKNYFDLRDFF